MTLRELFVWHSPVSAGRAWLSVASAVAIAAIAAPDSFYPEKTMLVDDHAVVSLEQAMTRAFCNAPSTVSLAASVAAALRADATLNRVPLRQVIEARAGSIDEYCRRADRVFVNNENTLMLAESALLRLRPGMSLEQLGRGLHAVRVVLLAASVFVVFLLGGSLWFGAGALLAGLVVMAAMPAFAFSAYPFMFVAVVALTAFYALAFHARWMRHWVSAAACGVSAGLLSGLVVNLRTSYVAVTLACGVGFLIAAWRVERRHHGWRMHAAAFVVAALAGYYGLYALVITAGVPAGFEQRLRHSIVHPLVLSMGVPPSDFSRELGVEWSDGVGPKIAQRIDPQSGFLDERYNNALRGFYQSLWRERTREMVALYALKFATTGSSMLTTMRDSPGIVGWLLNVLLAPLSWLTAVAWLFFIDLAVAVAAAVLFVKQARALWLGLALLALSGALLQAEAGIIYSEFVYQYHNFGAYFAMLLSLVALQVAVNAAWRTPRSGVTE